MADFCEAINRLVRFRHYEDGRFSPYPEEAIIEARELCEKFNLEESWRKPISRHIGIHTHKVIEVLSKINSDNTIVQDAIQANKEFKEFDPSYEEIYPEITTGLFCKLIVTGVDSVLFAYLRGYSGIKEQINNDDPEKANLVRKKIIELIQHYDSIMDPSKLCWALCLWQQEKDEFEESFAQLKEENVKDNGNAMKTWERLLTVCTNKLHGDSRKYIEKIALPASERKEFYGGACRPTAYTFLNLKRMSRLIEEDRNDIYQTVSEITDNIFSWIEASADAFHETPYLSALYVECLLENGRVNKEKAIEILAIVQHRINLESSGSAPTSSSSTEPTIYERCLRWLKQNMVACIVTLIFAGVIAIGKFTDALTKIWDFFSKVLNK